VFDREILEEESDLRELENVREGLETERVMA
jgi:hypothetical protein